jgi:hypothetical protein
MFSLASVTVQWPVDGEYSAAYTAEHREVWSPLGYLITVDPSRSSFEMRIPPGRSASGLSAAGGAPAKWRPGDPVVSVRLANPPVLLSNAEQRDLTDYLASQAGSDSPSSARPEVPRMKPLIEGVSPDMDGRIWLKVAMPSERYTPTVATRSNGTPFRVFNWRAPVAYDVYEPDGSYLMRVMPPAATFLSAVTGDVAWCLQRDVLGVYTIGKFRIVP